MMLWEFSMKAAAGDSFEISSPRAGVSGAPFVMIAEDDPELRKLLADTLVEDGCVVRTASDGRELLAMLSAVSRGEMLMPSLLVMDVRMPRCSGMDVLTALRLAEWEVPVVIITGFGDVELHANAETLGAAFVLDKPFDLDTLRCVVRALSLPPGTARSSNDDAPDAEVTRVTVRHAKGERS
ncbi:hypothetical protein BH11MYX4_BH11MYX4_12070 [soil metagenome]